MYISKYFKKKAIYVYKNDIKYDDITKRYYWIHNGFGDTVYYYFKKGNCCCDYCGKKYKQLLPLEQEYFGRAYEVAVYKNFICYKCFKNNKHKEVD